MLRTAALSVLFGVPQLKGQGTGALRLQRTLRRTARVIRFYQGPALSQRTLGGSMHKGRHLFTWPINRSSRFKVVRLCWDSFAVFFRGHGMLVSARRITYR